jgi:hypothetical protein
LGGIYIGDNKKKKVIIMELIPIIENSLLIFIGILLIVVLFSYISFKLGNSTTAKSIPHPYDQNASINSVIRKQSTENYIKKYPEQINILRDNNSPGIPHSYTLSNSLPVERDNKVISKRFILINDLTHGTTFSQVKNRI